MTIKELKEWRVLVKPLLLFIYTKEETEYILEWFDGMKARDEMDLMEYEVLSMDDLMEFTSRNFKAFNCVKGSLTSRLFLYAPVIIREGYAHGEIKS